MAGAGHCQALKAENSRLKQKLMTATMTTEKITATRSLDALKQLQQEVIIPQKEEMDMSIRSILITPTPTLSTVLETVTYVTTVTKNVTQDLVINFAGRKIATSIVEKEVVVSTTSSILSTTIEITPTPTWQTITITSTPTPPMVDLSAQLAQKEREKLDLMARLKSLQKSARGFGGVRAEVVEIPNQLDSFSALQQYLQKVREVQAASTQTIVAAPLVADPPTPSIPSTTVSTIFLSESVPGEYRTSLTTLTLQPQARHKRELHSNLLVTGIPELRIEDFGQNDLDLESSFASFCREEYSTVTHTVTKTECDNNR